MGRKIMNDDFLHEFRESPRENFARNLHDQLFEETTLMHDRSLSNNIEPFAKGGSLRLKRQWVTLTAAVFAFAILGSMVVLSHLPQAFRFTTSTPLDNLQVISLENANRIQEIETLGNGSVIAVAWSPDGKHLGVAGSLGVWLYDTEIPYAKPHLLLSPEGAVKTLAFSPDSNRIAAAGDSDIIYVWDTKTFENSGTIKANTSNIESISFSPDGKWLASGGGNWESSHEMIQIWDAITYEEISHLSTDGRVVGIAFSPDSTMLASATDHRGLTSRQTIKLWNIATASEQITIPNIDGYMSQIVFNPSGDLIAGNTGGVIKLWDVKTGQKIQEFEGDIGSSVSALYSPIFSLDGKTLAARAMYMGSPNGNQVWLFDVATGSLRHRLDLGQWTGYLGLASALAFSPDGGQLTAIADSDRVYLWDMASLEPMEIYSDFDAPIYDIDLHPDDVTVFGVDQNGRIFNWDLLNETTNTVIETNLHPSAKLAISSDGKLLAVGSGYNEATTKLFDIETGALLNSFELYGGVNRPVAAITFDPNNQFLVMNRIRPEVWNVETGKSYVTLDYGENTVYGGMDTYSMALSPNGKLLAAPVEGNTIRLWDVVTGEIVFDLSGHTDGIYELTFDPTGNVLVSTSEDGTTKFWDTETWGLLRTVEGNLYSMHFSPDGHLLTGLNNNRLELWDAASGLALATINANRTSSAEFSSDGRYIITGGYDGIIRIWGVLSQ
jgi:WD40 repeat protein